MTGRIHSLVEEPEERVEVELLRRTALLAGNERAAQRGELGFVVLEEPEPCSDDLAG